MAWSQIWPFDFLICKFWHLTSPTFPSCREACPHFPVHSQCLFPVYKSCAPHTTFMSPQIACSYHFLIHSYTSVILLISTAWNMLELACHGSVGSVKSQLSVHHILKMSVATYTWELITVSLLKYTSWSDSHISY